MICVGYILQFIKKIEVKYLSRSETLDHPKVRDCNSNNWPFKTYRDFCLLLLLLLWSRSLPLILHLVLLEVLIMASRSLIVVMARSTSIILVAMMRLELIMVISAVEVARSPPHTVVTMATTSPHVILVVTTSVHAHVLLSVVVASALTSHVIMVGSHLSVVVVAVVAVAWVLLASSSWRHFLYSIKIMDHAIKFLI